jgi:hypothetical protein
MPVGGGYINPAVPMPYLPPLPFLLSNLEKDKLLQTYGHEAAPTVVKDK